MKIGFIGCGNMGSAMIGGILRQGIFSKEEIIVSNLAEYLLLVNLVSLDPAEMETLLKAVQGWIREKHKGRGAVIQLPEDDSPECNEG